LAAAKFNIPRYKINKEGKIVVDSEMKKAMITLTAYTIATLTIINSMPHFEVGGTDMTYLIYPHAS
jgi:hypothetical protein